MDGNTTSLISCLDDAIKLIESHEITERDAKKTAHWRSIIEMVEQDAHESFVITLVSREDIDGLGWDGLNATDEQMERLAEKMGDDYVEQLFWSQIPIIAEYVGIERRTNGECFCKRGTGYYEECKFCETKVCADCEDPKDHKCADEFGLATVTPEEDALDNHDAMEVNDGYATNN